MQDKQPRLAVLPSGLSFSFCYGAPKALMKNCSIGDTFRISTGPSTLANRTMGENS